MLSLISPHLEVNPVAFSAEIVYSIYMCHLRSQLQARRRVCLENIMFLSSRVQSYMARVVSEFLLCNGLSFLFVRRSFIKALHDGKSTLMSN